MSRLDLNGLRPKRLQTNEEDFEFGVLPEDEIERSPSPCEEIDAVNTETFGEDVGAADFDDLEAYSKQTAGLKLEDNDFTAWGNQPSCSISAPDPSQLPDPTFESSSGVFSNSNYSQSAFGNSSAPYSSSFELNLGTVDSLFANNANSKSKESTIWGAPDLSSVITRSAMDFINKPDIPHSVISRNSAQRHNERPSVKMDPTITTPKKLVLAELPKNALTVEELEREQLQQTRNKKLPEVPRPADGALTLEELERQILGAASSSKDEPKPLGISVPPEVKHPPNAQFPLSPQPPLSYPFPYPMMNPLLLNLYRARMTGQLLDGPPGFPVVPPHLRMSFLEAVARSANAAGGFRYPVPPQMPGIPVPPFPSLLQASRMRMCNPRSPTPRSPFHAQNQGHGNMKNSIYREPQIKKTGLPSNKTISDFAFDPYAGFMSKKEREWLIKIQVLQCQGTGNPFDDDYYYTAWRERRASLEERAQEVKQEKADSDVTTATSSAHHYVPPTFVGSLGKPTLSTVNNPRQLIDLGRDGNDEDDRSSVKGTSQKRFRALLMLIENVAAYVLACEDRKRQLDSATFPDDIREQLQAELQSRLESLFSCLTGEKLCTVVTLNKGRQMFLRAFNLMDSAQQLTVFNAFLNIALSVALKAVSEEELVQSLLPPLVSYLSQCSKDELVKIICSFTVDGIFTVPTNLSNKFLCILLLTILLCAAHKHVELSSTCASSPLYSYLCGRKYPVQTPDEWFSLVTASSNFTKEDVAFLRQWLQKKFQRYSGSIGQQLVRKV